MNYNQDKVADAVLALLALTMHDESDYGARAWKSHDWAILDLLHTRGLIDDRKNKNKSVLLTAEGMRRSRELFRELFGGDMPTPGVKNCLTRHSSSFASF